MVMMAKKKLTEAQRKALEALEQFEAMEAAVSGEDPSAAVEEAPKARLTSPVAMSPPPSITEGESTSPTTPETNLEHP